MSISQSHYVHNEFDHKPNHKFDHKQGDKQINTADIIDTHYEEPASRLKIQNRGNNSSATPEQNPPIENKTKNLFNNWANWFRFLGVGTILLAGLNFMLEGMNNADVGLRYWVFLAIIGATTLAGVIVYKLADDLKSTRLLFGLATLLIPVHITQLASMIYSYTHALEPLAAHYTTLIFISSIILGVVTSYITFLILARPYAKPLTSTFIVFNGLMLLPIRDMPFAVIIAVVMIAFITFLHRKILLKTHKLASIEVLFVKLILLVPACIIVCRSGFSINELVGGSLIALSLSLTTEFTLKQLPDFRFKQLCAILSFTLLMAAWQSMASSMALQNFSYTLLDDYAVFLFFVPCIAYSMYKLSSKAYYGIALLTAFICTLSLTGVVFFEHTMGVKFLAITLLLALIFWAFQHRSLSLLSLCGFCIAALFINIVYLSINTIEVNSWIGLSAMGLTLVLSASFIEKYGKQAIKKGQSFLQEF